MSEDEQNLVILEALKDAEGIGATDTQINSLFKNTKRLFQLTAKFEKVEEEQKERTAEIQKLTTQTLPDLMIEARMLEYTFENGAKISRGATYLPSVKKEDEADVFEWMESQEHHGIIKSDVVVPFGKGGRVAGKKFIEILSCLVSDKPFDEGELEGLLKELRQLIDLAGIHLKEEIHWATMRAFVREQVELHEAKTKEDRDQTPPEELLPEKLKWIKQNRVKVDVSKLKKSNTSED